MEELVVIKSTYKLEGTLSFPNLKEDNYKAVLIIGGSGEFDRNGNYKGILLNTYKFLSDFLNEQGYATLRYDKRGIGNSEGIFCETGLNDLIDDVDNAYKLLERDNRIDNNNIYLLGHSEGAIISTIYNERNSKIKGLILLAGAGIDLKTAQTRQYTFARDELTSIDGIFGKIIRTFYKPEKLLKNQEDIYIKSKMVMSNTFRKSGKSIPAKWYREHLEYSKRSILNLLNKAKNSVLCTFGNKDIQSSVIDSDDIKKMNRDNIDIFEVKDMDHMLRMFDYKPTIINQTKQYKIDASLPLSPLLLNKIESWLLIN
ncbi:alpha/beta fold hydrolase [Mariniplasma anaerobium]|uniref:Alpha/beta hydrolase n=1 Tax=Mariniplasma anaerobium TaxID=2735436 RepID=A0A7U9TJ98_9MOLU|nr:alpha/beta fold hydrolase [Mariniplasma anaerobium]BCR35216.1 alpha/beta hydrolase [Mariniplasma anaerobium]